MSRKTGILAVVVVALVILLSNARLTPAQPAATAYYLTIDGTTNPPQVLSSTLTPQPRIIRVSEGFYRLTFSREFRFLVGTAHGIDLGGGDIMDLRLLAAKDSANPRIWYINTRRLGSGWGVDAPTFSLIVRAL